MKKLITLLLACASMFFVKAQTQKNQQQEIMIPSCSMDDWILLQKAPQYGISSEDAAAIIQNEKDKIAYASSDGYYYHYSKEKDRLGMLKLNASNEKFYRFLQENSAGKREWVESKNYFFFSHTASNWRFRVFCIVSFLFIFLFLLAIINEFNYSLKWSGDNGTKYKVLKNGLIASASFGLLAWMVYLLSLNANLEPGNRIKFQVLEPTIFIIGSALSFLLYLGLLSVIYWSKKQISKLRKKDLAVS